MRLAFHLALALAGDVARFLARQALYHHRATRPQET